MDLFDRRERRGPLELVDRTMDRASRSGTIEERHQRLEQPARQPVVRRGADDVGRLVLKPVGVLLGGHRAAVEEGRMDEPGFHFGLHFDLRLVLRVEMSRIAVERQNLIGICMVRFCAVIGPLERLHRMLAGGKSFPGSRMRFGLLERFRPPQPDGIPFGVIGALEGEAAKARPGREREVEAEEHHVDSRDCVAG